MSSKKNKKSSTKRNNNGKSNRGFLIFSIVFTVLSIVLTIVLFIFKKDRTYPEGRVITEEYMYALRTYQLNLLPAACMVFLSIAGICLILTALWWNIADKRGHYYNRVKGFAVVLAAVVMSIRFGADAVDLATHKPHVETAVITEHRSTGIYASRRQKVHHYYLTLSNGREIEVSLNEYQKHEDGTEVYVILCGNTSLKVCSTDDYLLEEEADGS